MFPFIGKYDIRNRGELLAEQKAKYGPIIKTKMGPYWFVHLFDPNDIEHVIRSASKYPETLKMPLAETYGKRKNKTLSFALE